MVEDCKLGRSVSIPFPSLVNLYGCTIGERAFIAPFVEIQRGAVIGAESKVCSHAFICGDAQIGERVFIGHGVMFCNDLFPVLGTASKLLVARIEDDVSIGTGVVLLPVTVGMGSIIGAGATVVRDVPPLSVVVGNPGRVIRSFASLAERQDYIDQWTGASQS